MLVVVVVAPGDSDGVVATVLHRRRARARSMRRFNDASGDRGRGDDDGACDATAAVDDDGCDDDGCDDDGSFGWRDPIAFIDDEEETFSSLSSPGPCASP